MSKIFISGTAGFGTKVMTQLPSQILPLLDNIIANHDTVLVGDCQGVDSLVQFYFKEKQYKNVVVYCSGNICRYILDATWPVIHVSVPYGCRGRDFFAVKDKQMAEDADLGIAIWDGKSKGTKANIDNLHSMNKKTTVFRTDLNMFE